MFRSSSPTRRVVSSITTAVLLGMACWAVAQQPPPPYPYPTPCAGGCVCIPNAGQFGYFPTLWRTWPCEPRPEVVFPQSVGVEQIPTPPGEEQLPAPVASPIQEPIPTPPSEGGLTLPGLPEEPRELGPVGPRAPSVLPGVPLIPDRTVPGAEEENPFEPKPDRSATGPPPRVFAIASRPAVAETPVAAEAPASVVLPRFPRRQSATAESWKPAGEQPVAASGLPRASTCRLAQTPQRGVSRSDQLARSSMRLSAPESPRGPVEGAIATSRPVKEPCDEETGSAEAYSQTMPSPSPTWAREAFAEASPAAPRRLEEVAEGASPLPASDDVGAHPVRPSGPVASLVEPTVRANAPLALAAVPQRPNDRSSTEAGPEAGANRPARLAGVPSESRPTPDSPSGPEGVARSPAPALGGYCPVALVEAERWTPGNPALSASSQGHVYYFSTSESLGRFLAEPERYAPVYRGQDPVLLLDECRRVEGHPDYCVTYAGRLYSFSCEKTLERFQQSPEKYAVPSDR